MSIEEIIDNLELYTVGRPKKDRLFMTVEELQNIIDEIKTLKQEPVIVIDKIRAELIQSIQNGTLKIYSGNEELFHIIDKYKKEIEDKE